MYSNNSPVIHDIVGVVSVRYQRTASGDVAVLAQRKNVTAEGVCKPINGTATDDAVKVKALLKCSSGKNDTSHHYHVHHNGTIVNGKLM